VVGRVGRLLVGLVLLQFLLRDALRLGQRLGAAQGFIGHAQIAAGRDQGRGGLGQIRDLHGVEQLALAHVVARAHGHLTDAALVGREHLHRLVLVQIDDADGLALLGKDPGLHRRHLELGHLLGGHLQLVVADAGGQHRAAFAGGRRRRALSL
jgi:hypothetical protein